jgi:hypothetical protein
MFPGLRVMPDQAAHRCAREEVVVDQSVDHFVVEPDHRSRVCDFDSNLEMASMVFCATSFSSLYGVMFPTTSLAPPSIGFSF